MGINGFLRVLGTITFSQPTVMTALFAVFYLVLGLIALTRPVAAVVMYFGTSIMNPQASYSLLLDIPLAKITAGVCLFACLLNARKLSFPFTWTCLPLIAFLVMANVAAYTALNPVLADQRFEEFNKIALMVVLAIWATKDRKDYDFLFWGILGSIGYDVLKNLVETQTKEVWVSVKGVAGWISDSNDWALALAMALPLFYAALALHWNKGWKVRLVLGAAASGALLTLTLTYSRGGFLAALVSGVVFMLLDRKPWRAVGVAAAIVAVVAVYMPGSYVDKVESLFGLEAQAASAWEKNVEEIGEYTGAERVYYWRIAYEIMRDHPLTGVGWGNFIKEFERRENLTEGVVAHSTWFQVGSESGMLSLSFYVLMIVSALGGLFATWFKARRMGDVWGEMHSRAVIAGLVAFCVGATFLSRENSELLFVYIAMAVVLGGLVWSEKPKPAEDAVRPAPAWNATGARKGNS